MAAVLFFIVQYLEIHDEADEADRTPWSRDELDHLSETTPVDNSGLMRRSRQSDGLDSFAACSYTLHASFAANLLPQN